MKIIKLMAVALLFSAGAYAQSSRSVGGPDHPGLHKGQYKQRSKEQRTAMKMERRAQYDNMTPAEREAYKQAHRQEREARMANMTPEQRARKVERHRTKKTYRKEEKSK
jgi:hypothetical protein